MKSKATTIVKECLNYIYINKPDFYVNCLGLNTEFGRFTNFVKVYDTFEKKKIPIEFNDDSKEVLKKTLAGLFFYNGLLLGNNVVNFKNNIDIKAINEKYNYLTNQYRGKSVAFLSFRYLTLFGNVSSTISGKIKTSDNEFRFQNLTSMYALLIFMYDRIANNLKDVINGDDIYTNYFKPLLGNVKEETNLEKEVTFQSSTKAAVPNQANNYQLDDEPLPPSVSIPVDFMLKARETVEKLEKEKEKK